MAWWQQVNEQKHKNVWVWHRDTAQKASDKYEILISNTDDDNG